ncbi:MAG: PEP-CTERM sorting domain-containing protein [Bryobacteraceae bacterium]|nr:PEP-CTERM sorting domain-containing protein [Bryobacteraceae bacterium]
MNILRMTLLYTAALAIAGAAPLITLNSAGIRGYAGRTTGWSATVQADSSEWISLSGTFLYNESSPLIGTYIDIAGGLGGPVNFSLAPGAPDWVLTFSGPATGFANYAIDAFAPPGAVNQAILRVLYEGFSDDPLTCGFCQTTSSFVDLPVTVEVAPVPEPGSALLVAAGAAAMAWRRKVSARGTARPASPLRKTS